MNNYHEKIFSVDFKTVREWARNTPNINNVLRGYWNECFAVSENSECSNEIDFVYIQYSDEYPGLILRLKYKEAHFYDYLLMFATEICRDNRKLEIINVYNTFTNSYRTFLAARDIEPIFSNELLSLPRGGEIILASDFEIIQSVDRVQFYRRCLGEENYTNFKEDTEYVYVMLNKDDATFKIGQSKKPIYREGTLQSKQPGVVLLKVWECDKKIEKDLHKHYIHKRVRGEWFRLDFGDLAEFENIINMLIISKD